MTNSKYSRRATLLGLSAALASPGIARAQLLTPNPVAPARRNASSFVTQNWRDHFKTLGKGVIVADTFSRALHYWNADGSDYRIYPTSVPMTDDLTKRGYTEIVRKKVGPTWTPTKSMRERDPTLPDFM